MKKQHTLKGRRRSFVTAAVLILLILIGLSAGFTRYAQWRYQQSLDRLLVLEQFYGTLDDLNARVYTYTLDGDEGVYRQIWEMVLQMRGNIRELTEVPLPRSLYRRLRDLEDMFYTYTRLTERIYDHAYLCAQITVSGKQVINQYYSETQQVYQAISSEFSILYDLMLRWAQDTQSLAQRQNRFLLTDLVLVILASAFFLMRQMSTLSRSIVRPLQELTRSAAQIRVEEETVLTAGHVAESKSMDEEMRQLIQVHNSMLDRIHNQVAQIKEASDTRERLRSQELENLRIANLLKTSELQALQMQINPHYLFNTLNMISQTAFLEEAVETKELLDTAAGLFRYTMDYSGKEVTLARELEILGSYVELQERRFGSRIRFDFLLDESFHGVSVPSMILQPLVENALIHGVPMKLEGAVIRIITRRQREGEFGEILIQDNGAGMDADTLERVRRDMTARGGLGTKLGLNNVYQRLKIFYADEADMTLRSTPETGTEVCLRIPLGAWAQRKPDASPEGEGQ